MIDQSEVGAWQDLFTSIIEDADSNILLLDDEFRIVTINPAFYWIFLEIYGVELKKNTFILQAMHEVDLGTYTTMALTMPDRIEWYCCKTGGGI